MNKLFKQISDLIKIGEIRISAHGYDELANDNIYVKDLVSTINSAVLIQEYPEYSKGPCVLVLHYDESQRPVHAVRGIPKNLISPAVLITAYRPDPEIWNSDFRTRKK